MSHREPGIIRDYFYGKEDHGILTCILYMELNNGGVQGYVSPSLDETLAPLYIQDLCFIFGIHTNMAGSLSLLKDKKCHVLRYYPYYNEYIIGLETEIGRFTSHNWIKNRANDIYLKHWKPEVTRRIENLNDREARLKKELAEMPARRINIVQDFKDWDNE